MAANMKAVKLRMKSIQSTMQITKAVGTGGILQAAAKQRNVPRSASPVLRCFGIPLDRLHLEIQISCLLTPERAKAKNGVTS